MLVPELIVCCFSGCPWPWLTSGTGMESVNDMSGNVYGIGSRVFKKTLKNKVMELIVEGQTNSSLVFLSGGINDSQAWCSVISTQPNTLHLPSQAIIDLILYSLNPALGSCGPWLRYANNQVSFQFYYVSWLMHPLWLDWLQIRLEAKSCTF